MKKKLITLLILTGLWGSTCAQELNCEVTVIAPQIANVDASIFEIMESTIRDFMNDRKWTGDDFTIEERIDCSIQLTINEAVNNTSFVGTMQVQASRPVYNSDYNSPTFLVNDSDVQFTFLQNTILQFTPDQHRDNLSSLLAFYAYMILGTDYDTMALEGGTDHYLKAQIIVSNAQNAAETGWKSSQNQQNRYWLVENVLSQTFKPLRDCLYHYHRNGFDKFFSTVEEPRMVIAESLYDLEKIHKVRPSSYNLQLFFMAKADEIVNLFKSSTNLQEKQLIYLTLKKVDPGNISKYEKIMK